MGVLAGKNIYLSGPLDLYEGHDWRLDLVPVLQNRFGLNIFDPFSDPKQNRAAELHAARDRHDYDAMTEIARDFVAKDLKLVYLSHILLAYLPYKVPTYGATHEIVAAINNKTPVIIVCEEGVSKIPSWFFGIANHKRFFASFEQVYSYLQEVEDGKHKSDRHWKFVYGLI